MKSFRVLGIAAFLILAAGIAFILFSVHSRMTASEYQFQVEAVLSAATVANRGEALTDPDKAVIAEYEGKRTVIVPGNYRALSAYLRKDAAAPPFLRMDKEKAMKLTVCEGAVFYLSPDEKDGDIVRVLLETGGKTFRMRTSGGNQWTSLLAVCTSGTYHDENIPLD